MLAGWGRIVARRRWIVLIASGLLLCASVVVVAQGGRLSGGGPIDTTESGRAAKLIRDEIPPVEPAATGSSFDLVYSGEGLKVADAAFRAALLSSLEPLRADPRVRSIQTPYDAGTTGSLVSRDGSTALVVVTVKDNTSTAEEYYRDLRALVRSDELEILATGGVPIRRAFDHTLESDLQRAEVVSLPLALLLLVLVFGTIVAALLPVGVGILAIVGGLAGTFLLTRVTDVSQYALNIVTLIGLGVAIDYSLFIVNRFREELRGGASTEAALSRSLATAGRAITFSGVTVAIGLAGMLFYPGTFLVSMGLAGAIVVAVAVLYALTFLPALLAILGPRVNRWRVPFVGTREGRMWHRIANAVMRRPLVVLLPALLFILATGSPFLHLRLANADVDALPPQDEARRGWEVLLRDFPGLDQTRVTLVARFADGDPLSRAHVDALYALTRAIAALPNAIRVDGALNLAPQYDEGDYVHLYDELPRASLPAAFRSVLRQSVGPHIVVLSTATDRRATSDEARDLVRAIRALPSPAGLELFVAGQTANDIDAIALLAADTPAAIGFVVLTTYFVLFLLLGSVLLPLKAIVMNFLSITASFGAMVWIFQDGHLASQLNFTAQSIDPTLPPIMFCIVFGLSMDYEVLLLSRMQEEYARTGDNRQAVAEGLERIGRLITGAAAIMVGVFAAFALAEVVIIKAIGLGMAIAVALDATLVRALIVPATMRLLGDLNWWAPPPLARLYRRLGLAESSRTAPVAMEAAL